jgi:MinD superfamily P-loop ATPase
MVVVNKSDLHPTFSDELAARLDGEGFPVAARFPYDEAVTEAVRAGKILSETSRAWYHRFDRLWQSLQATLFSTEAPIRIGTASVD